MTIRVGMHEAKTTLSRLVDAAQAGQEVILTRRGQPVVRLQAVSIQPRKSLFGALAGQIWMADDFDELPEDVLEEFEGGRRADPLR
jgi:prevent-host-death family protein